MTDKTLNRWFAAIAVVGLFIIGNTAEASEFVAYKDGAKVTLTEKACSNKAACTKSEQAAKLVTAEGKSFNGCWEYTGIEGKTFVSVVWYAADGKRVSTTKMDATEFAIVE